VAEPENLLCGLQSSEGAANTAGVQGFEECHEGLAEIDSEESLGTSACRFVCSSQNIICAG